MVPDRLRDIAELKCIFRFIFCQQQLGETLDIPHWATKQKAKYTSNIKKNRNKIIELQLKQKQIYSKDTSGAFQGITIQLSDILITSSFLLYLCRFKSKVKLYVLHCYPARRDFNHSLFHIWYTTHIGTRRLVKSNLCLLIYTAVQKKFENKKKTQGMWTTEEKIKKTGRKILKDS